MFKPPDNIENIGHHVRHIIKIPKEFSTESCEIIKCSVTVELSPALLVSFLICKILHLSQFASACSIWSPPNLAFPYIIALI